MTTRFASTLRLLVAGVLSVALAASAAGAGALPPSQPQTVEDLAAAPRAATPEDRYAMAGGCYVLRPAGGDFVERAGGGFAATAPDASGAEPFTFQATDLGRYLLYGTPGDFLAASEGLAGTAAYAATESLPGRIAGGVALEQTDAAADAVAASDANRLTGRGASVVAAPEPSDLADWQIDEAPGGFTLWLPATGQALVAGTGGALVLADAPGSGSVFALSLATGCTPYPEIEVNVAGDPPGGAAPFAETRGFMDAHLHMMAFEFLGGRARCGRPWHRFGVAYALVDCPDHEPNGAGAVLEQVLSGPGRHDTSGWPTFTGWPRYNSLTHEQVYYKWLERAWRGGLRMFTNLLVDNRQLCQVYPFRRNSCNEMDGVRLQALRIRELERYIDAQSGGPGEGWFRIVTDPFEAREVVNAGKLAVVLGIEVSVPLDCGEILELPQCNTAEMLERLDDVYDLGVRQMELVNKFDNALSGVTGDAGSTGVVVNQGNRGETGHYWKMETCDDHEPSDRLQHNVHDNAGTPDQVTGRDSLVGAILQLFGPTGAAPVYPEGPHCNVIGLSDLGEAMINGMMDRGMIFDPDHMSARARTEAIDLIEAAGYSGVVSSHGWADDTIYSRIYPLGGVVAPYAGGSTSFVSEWIKHRGWSDARFTFGFPYGADTNGFGSQGGPRKPVTDPVTYPFTGLGGVVVGAQQSGTRVYDVNTDGVAHYGLYPDWIEDLRKQAGDAIVDDMAMATEAYLQMWERAVGIAGDACRADVDDLSDARVGDVGAGATVREVLDALGQPATRTAAGFTFCMTGGRTASVALSPGGLVTGVSIS